MMEIEYDPAKRESNLAKHGLDFDDAHKVFEQPYFFRVDERFDYGEERCNLIGRLGLAIVAMTFTECGDVIRVISLRKAIRRERYEYERFAAGGI